MSDNSQHHRRKDDSEPRSKEELKEAIARNNIQTIDGIGNLVHELQVHQAELKMQNQALRKIQRQLEETRDRYSDLYDFAPVGYLTFDKTGRVIEINLTGASMLGHERQKIVNQPFSIYLARGDVQVFEHHLHQAFGMQGNVISELSIKSAGLKPRFVRLESVAIGPGNNICRTVMIDITTEYLAKDALQNSLAAREALLQAIPVMIFYQNVEQTFLAVSQVFADLVGCSIADLVGKTPKEVLPEQMAKEFEISGKQVLESDGVIVVPEYEMLDANSKPIVISLVRTPYRDANGVIIGMVGAGIDITLIRKIAIFNARLVQENRGLTRSLFEIQEKERRHLARELHDEMGQWITAIQAESQAILNITGPEAKIYDSAKAIKDSAKAMHEVVHNMLGQLRPGLLDELGLEYGLRELQAQWCHQHADIVCDFYFDCSFEDMDDYLNITVYRLIQEALTNISKHAHASKICIRLERQLDKVFGREALLLNIDDNGMGFNMNKRTEGMGLLGMRERVIVAGGEFVFYSETGKGAHIQVRLPLKHGVSS